MVIGKRILFSAICWIACLSAGAQSNTPPQLPLHDQIQILEVAVEKFKAECVKDNKLDRSRPECIAEKRRLDQTYERLEKETKDAHVTDAAPELACSANSASVPNQQMISEVSAAVDKAMAANSAKTCSENTEVLSTKCLRELACAPLKKFALDKLASVAEICGARKGQVSDCVTELLNGVIRAVYGSAKALVVDLPKLLASGAEASWKWLFGLEEKTSDALIAATGANNKTLADWAHDKAKFISEFGEKFLMAIDAGIRNAYGCDVWEGIPHMSKCLQPMKSWSCATCTQRAQAICGIAGYLGGELVASYLVGGAAAVVKAIAVGAKSAAVAGGKSTMQFLKIKPELKGLAEAGALGRRWVGAAGSALAPAAEKVGSIGRKLAAIEGPDFLKSAPVQAISAASGKTVQITTAPFTAYWQWLGDATSMGYRHGEKVLYLTAKNTRNAVMIITLEGPIKEGQAVQLSQESIRELRKYGDVHLESGGTRINFDQSTGTLTLPPPK